MERLSPIPAADTPIAEAPGVSSGRAAAYVFLALLLAGGGWVRFNNQLASLAPGLAGPAAGIAAAPAQAGPITTLLELSMLPQHPSAEAIAALGLPPGASAAMVEAVRRNRVRLVQMPLFDAGPTGSGVGHVVEVSSGGYSRLVQLSRQPVIVTVPIDRAGTVAFRIPDSGASADTLGIGAVTATGPVRLPDLAHGQELDVGVIAQ